MIKGSPRQEVPPYSLIDKLHTRKGRGQEVGETRSVWEGPGVWGWAVGRACGGRGLGQ